MAGRRYVSVFYVAVAIAAIATFGVYRVLESTKASSRIATRPLVVAAKNLAEGTSIDRSSISVREWPVATVPAGAYASPDSLIGRVTRVPVFEGEALVPGRLAPAGTGPGIEVKIAPGKRAMGLRINDVAGVSGLIQPNSRVDVLVNINSAAQGGRQVSKLFMENMRVLSVGTQVERDADGKAISATTAALEVTPEEAERLAVAVNQGSIQLVLRGYGDPDSVRTRGASSSDVLSQLATAPERVADAPVRKPPVRRSPPPKHVDTTPTLPVATTPPLPEKPDSLTVTVFRGTDVQRQKFEKPSTPKTSPQR
ncbi:MAG TPA: Flp pilus assembly protein CpaB [Gemmatimonadaceae bacterium]|jgi:pilus assembly protein CpaB|nr:Flp pilus assembly protein CpaB [Gemmatimonadaceae bacterium]